MHRIAAKPAVRILLSYDGGQTFPKVLKASTANDGAEKVKFPNSGTLAGRVRIEAVGNIYFDISDKNFAIDAGYSLVGTWDETDALTNMPFSRFTFSADTVTRCYLPANTSCQVTNTPYTFEDYNDPVLTKKLSIPALPFPDDFWLCKIIDNNTFETYRQVAIPNPPFVQNVHIGTLVRQN